MVPTRFSAIRDFAAPDAEERFLRGLPLEGATIYDIGAFHGVTTLFFAAKAGPSGCVVASSRTRRAADRSTVTFDVNRLNNVTVRNVAVGSRAGELEFLGPVHGDGITSADPEIQRQIAARIAEVERITVPVVTIDHEADSGLPQPDFVKIDVEGLELEVLRGMRETITRHKPRLFVEIHGATAEDKRANAARVVELLCVHRSYLHHVESDRPVTSNTAARASEGHLYCE